MPIRLHCTIASLVGLALLAASGCSYISDLSVCDRPQVDPTAAVAACTRIIDSGRMGKTGVAVIYVDRAGAYFNLADFDHALADLSAAIQAQPELELAWLRRSALHAKRGELDLALADARQAMALNPQDAQARSEVAEALELKHDYAGALAELDTLIATRPDDPSALNSRCWLRAIQGRELDQALADCDRSLRLAPESAATFDSRGLVHFRMGQYADAIRDYDAAIARWPRLGSSYYVRGLAKRASGDAAGAASDIESGKSLDAGVVSTYQSYGVVPN